jgi:hypothetical protein
MPANFFDSLGFHTCDCKPAPPVLELGPDQTVFADDTVTLDAGIFATYDWSTGEHTQTIKIDSSGVGLGTKKIYCTVSDEYGVQSDTIYISFKSQLLNLGPDQSVYIGDTVTLDAGVFTTYDWSTGEHTRIVKVDSSGVGFGTKKVYCTVSDEYGVQSDTVRITFKPYQGIFDHKSEMNVTIHPNPVINNQFTITANLTVTSIEVVSIIGKTVYSKPLLFNQKEVQVVLNEIPDGVYFVRISYGNNQSVIKKIIIN